MRTQWLGTFDYVKSLEMQNEAILTAEHNPVVFGLEHPSTITLGRRGDPIKDILVGFKTLREKSIPIVAVERGGQATYHNPGQLVIYPVISLRALNIGVKDYVAILEDVTKRLLNSYGLTACCKGDEPGLFTIKGKIAFYGVRVSRGVTSHGLAINVTNDLSEFSMIRSCGKSGEHLAKLGDFIDPVPSLETLFSEWSQLFLGQLGLLTQVNPKSQSLTPEYEFDNLKPEIVLT
jgi:lipoyl(octanoyl) transferase